MSSKNKREIKIINKVIQILDKPQKWTRARNAKDKNGNPTNPLSPNATCYCLEGAIYKALWEQKLSKRKWNNSYRKIIGAICKVAGLNFDIGNQDEHIGFNDNPNTTYEMIINILKKAKALLQKGE